MTSSLSEEFKNPKTDSQFQIGLVHYEDLKIQNSRAVIKWGQTHKNV